MIDTHKIYDILQKSDFVMACYLLGSAAREELRFNSDIDLALLFEGGVTHDHDQIRALSLQLSEALGRMVDIGVLSSRNLVYAHQAVFTGKRIFFRDHLGVPQSSADAFRFLNESEVIPKEMCSQMVAMIGFRNIAVHEYQELDMGVVRSIATHDWKNMVEFVRKCGVTIQP